MGITFAAELHGASGGMTDSKDDKAERPAQPKKPGKGDRAFDMWLKNSLHRLYDDIANEAVPDDLLRMIQEDRKK